MIGTRYTLPPEIISLVLETQILEDTSYNALKVDVWTLGIMAFKIQTKLNPFYVEDLKDMLDE